VDIIKKGAGIIPVKNRNRADYKLSAISNQIVRI